MNYVNLVSPICDNQKQTFVIYFSIRLHEMLKLKGNFNSRTYCIKPWGRFWLTPALTDIIHGQKATGSFSLLRQFKTITTVLMLLQYGSDRGAVFRRSLSQGWSDWKSTRHTLPQDQKLITRSVITTGPTTESDKLLPLKLDTVIFIWNIYLHPAPTQLFTYIS